MNQNTKFKTDRRGRRSSWRAKKLRIEAATGYLLAIGATILWSGNFIVARGLSDTFPPISLAFWRWVVAVAALLPFGVKSLVSEWHTIKSNIGYLMATALIGVSIFNTLIYFAGHTTSAVNLSLIAITCPIFILILSQIVYREMITLKKLAGVIITLSGVLMLISNGSLSTLLKIHFVPGDPLMLLASILFAVYSILVKAKPVQLSMHAFLLSTFILGLAALFPFFVWEYRLCGAPEISCVTTGSILYVGICASVLAFFMWNQAIVRIGPAKTAVLYYTLPIYSGITAALFLDERIRLFQAFSMLLIVAGIVIANHHVDNSSQESILEENTQ